MSQNQENKDDFFNIYTESERPTLGLVDYLMVTLVPLTLIAAYVFFMSKGVRGLNHYLSNGTFAVGVVYFTIGTFGVLSHYGNYDSMSYGIKRFASLFRRNTANKSVKERVGTFFDYKREMVVKRARKAKPVKWHYLICGVVILIASFIITTYKPF